MRWYDHDRHSITALFISELLYSEDSLLVAEDQVEVGNTTLVDHLRPLKMLHLPRGAAI